MGLETATYIDGLVVTNPTATDPKSQGDDHLRLVKSTIKNTFPNVSGAVTPTHTELNFVDGVTSAIQGQIDSKGAITGQTWTGTHDFPSTVSFGNVSSVEVSYLDGVTSAIQTQFTNITSTLIPAKGAITGQTWTGTHDYTGATITVLTQSPGDNSTKAASTAFVIAQAFSTALPSQAGNAGKYITTNGSTASWQTVSGAAPVGSLIANKNVGTSFTDASAVWLRTGVIAASATYPLAPTTTINDGATWLTKTGVSLASPRLASNGSGTVIAVSLGSAGTGYAISTDYGSTWAAATFPASISGVPVWCGTFFLIVNRNGGVAATTFYTSATGATGSWTSRTVPSNIFSSGVYGSQGCIITTTTTQGYITTDGITYTSITMPIAAMAGTFGNGFYVFANPTASFSVYKTSNGASFATKTVPVEPRYNNVNPPFAFGEGVFLYAQDAVSAKCFTTSDFETFAISNTGIAIGNNFARVFGNGTFLLLQSGTAAYSSDDLGATWTARTMVANTDWACVVNTGTSFAGLAASTTTATQSVSGGTYTDTAKAMFADSPENTRPFYMRVA